MANRPFDLDAVEARAAAATDEPWELVVDDHGGDEVETSIWSEPAQRYVAEIVTRMSPADAEFVVHALADVKAMSAEIRRLRAELATTRIAVLREVADECDEAGSKYTARALNDHAAGAFTLMETFQRKANETEHMATPCDPMVPCEDGGEPCHVHERLMAHSEDDHELCEPDCSQLAATEPHTVTDDTIWLERRPCGCVVSAVVAVLPGEWMLATAKDAAMHFHATEGERRDAARAGLSIEPVSSAQYRENFRDRWKCDRHLKPAGRPFHKS